MADDKRGAKRKATNPASLFLILAVVTYFVGLPFPVTAFLGFIAFILFRAQKDAKTLKDLPIPPASDEQSEDFSSDFGRQPTDDMQEWLRQHMPSEADSLATPRTSDQQPTLAGREIAPISARGTDAARAKSRSSPYGFRRATSRDMALQLKNQQGIRQAIVAMAVLGPPRALNAYVSDPMQGVSLDATPFITKPNN